MKLFVNTQGRVMGPVDVERILTMAEKGRLSPDATVSEDRMNWIPISELKSLIQQANEESAVKAKIQLAKEENPVVQYSAPQGYNQGASYGAPQGYNQGAPYGAPQAYNQGAPYGAPQAYNQGATYGTPQGYNQGMPQEYNQGAPGNSQMGYPQGMQVPGAMQGNNTKICPACGQPIAPNASVCHHCGTHFRFCPNCGTIISRPEQLVCTQCGCSLGSVGAGMRERHRGSNNTIQPNGKSASTAMWLSCLLVGAGQMYLGQVAKGIIILVVGILLSLLTEEAGAGGIGGIIVLIIAMSDAYKQGKKMENGESIGQWTFF